MGWGPPQGRPWASLVALLADHGEDGPVRRDLDEALGVLQERPEGHRLQHHPVGGAGDKGPSRFGGKLPCQYLLTKADP